MASFFRARHPLGVLSVIVAFVSAAVVTASSALVGKAAANLEGLYGRSLLDIPFAQLPPSISVYVVVVGIGWLAWLVAVVLALVALIRFRCRFCGTVALALCTLTPIAATIAWMATNRIA